MLLKRLDELWVFKTNQVTCLDIQKEYIIYYDMTGIHKYLLFVLKTKQKYIWRHLCMKIYNGGKRYADSRSLVWESMVQLLLLIGIPWFGIHLFNYFYWKSAVILLNHPFHSRRTHTDILSSNGKVSRSCKINHQGYLHICHF